jgi:hypothetical protein
VWAIKDGDHLTRPDPIGTATRGHR